MKQFTTKQQTDRLIELGYPKPNSIKSAKMGFFMGTKIPCIEKEFAYSIGELMELLPDDGVTNRRFEFNEYNWFIDWDSFDNIRQTVGVELIDAIFAMLVDLKEGK